MESDPIHFHSLLLLKTYPPQSLRFAMVLKYSVPYNNAAASLEIQKATSSGMDKQAIHPIFPRQRTTHLVPFFS
jgi:hypothetical protein